MNTNTNAPNNTAGRRAHADRVVRELTAAAAGLPPTATWVAIRAAEKALANKRRRMTTADCDRDLHRQYGDDDLLFQVPANSPLWWNGQPE